MTTTPTPDQIWWGMAEDRAELDQLIGIVSRALFHDFDAEGPRFLWAANHPLLDDDPLLGCAADQVTTAVSTPPGRPPGTPAPA